MRAYDDDFTSNHNCNLVEKPLHAGAQDRRISDLHHAHDISNQVYLTDSMQNVHAMGDYHNPSSGVHTASPLDDAATGVNDITLNPKI